jgi:hypothetical protein
MQVPVLVLNPAPAEEKRFETGKYAWQVKSKLAAGCHSKQRSRLRSMKEPRRLLVQRSNLKKLVIKITRQKRLPLSLPLLIVGSRKLHPRLPMAGNRPEARWTRTIIPGLDQLIRILDIRYRNPLKVAC